jgi:hypothetical protein
MSSVFLPLLEPSTRLGSAFETMEQNAVSGVIVPVSDDHFQLVHAADIVTSGRNRSEPLSAIGRRTIVPRISEEDYLRNDRAFPGNLRAPMRQHGLPFVIISMRTKDDSAEVLPASEDGTFNLMLAPTTCYCKNPVIAHPYAKAGHPEICTVDYKYRVDCW